MVVSTFCEWNMWNQAQSLTFETPLILQENSRKVFSQLHTRYAALGLTLVSLEIRQ